MKAQGFAISNLKVPFIHLVWHQPTSVSQGWVCRSLFSEGKKYYTQSLRQGFCHSDGTDRAQHPCCPQIIISSQPFSLTEIASRVLPVRCDESPNKLERGKRSHMCIVSSVHPTPLVPASVFVLLEWSEPCQETCRRLHPSHPACAWHNRCMLTQMEAAAAALRAGPRSPSSWALIIAVCSYDSAQIALEIFPGFTVLEMLDRRCRGCSGRQIWKQKSIEHKGMPL